MVTENKIKIKIKKWGEEHWFVNNKNYCSKYLYIKKDHRCSKHYHKIKTETFIAIKGEVILNIYDKKGEKVKKRYLMTENKSINIPKNTIHEFIGIKKDNIMLEVSTKHYEKDSYRLNTSK
jgi:cupin fold WbuC family metalloprotein